VLQRSTLDPAVLPQTPHEAVRVFSGAGHRQAPRLRSGASGGNAVGRAPAIEIPQPRRELSSAHPTTRTGDETLQIVAACATVPVRRQRHLRTLPAATASAQRDVRGGQYERFGGIVLTDTFQITEPGDTMDAEIFPQNNDRILWLVKQQRHFVHLRCTSTAVVTVVVDVQERLTRRAWLD